MHILYRDESLKKLAGSTTLAEMLGCKLMSNLAASIKHLYFT
jgi:hypothetical protein